MASFEGRTVALLESRMRDELADMVRRMGGRPLLAPAVREVPRLDTVSEYIQRLADERYRLVVFLTGAGATAMFREAERLGRLAAMQRAMAAMVIAARGPKPLAVLRRQGLNPTVLSRRPHTSAELLDALQSETLDGVPTLLVHYGERSAETADALRARGAQLDEALPYEWALPDDPQPLASLVADALSMRVDAMLFTSQVQCRHLFQVAAEMQLAAELAETLNRDVVVGAVGPVCAAAISSFGVSPDVLPASPNMVALITAVADYFDLTSD
jgi:uroporphyrinogen-III synthase